jgi:hypothetical protein
MKLILTEEVIHENHFEYYRADWKTYNKELCSGHPV